MAKKPGKRPIAIDLFAGAGGLSLGFEQAGFDVVASVEIDPIHCATHHYNFPNGTPICASVVDLTGEEIREISGIGDADIDVVCGGAPCQGFSTIGKRALDDERNQLVFHYCRLIGELKPKYAVFENVRGLTLGEHKKFLQEIIEALHGLGYTVLLPYRVLNAADYGVPQDRKRLFLIAAREGQTLPKYPAPTGSTTVGDAILDLPNADSYKTLATTDSVRVKYSPKSAYSKRMHGVEADSSDKSYPRAWDSSFLTASLRTEHTEVSKARFKDTPHGVIEPISRFLKLDPQGLCNTLRAGTDSARGAFTSPRPIHPIHPRVITVREAARLHSYPDWFRFHVTKWHGFRQIGNSVPPLLGRAVAGEIVKALGARPAKPAEAIPLGEAGLLSLDMSEASRRFNVPRNVIRQRTRKDAKRVSTVALETAEIEEPSIA